jgi:acyl-CoA thioesterase
LTDARKFLGIEPVGDNLHWQLKVIPELTTPGNFLFGGCGLAAALVALEEASGRPTVWATAQYLSYAATGSVLDLTVTLPAEGKRVTQGRVVAKLGDKEILTLNGAVGTPGSLDLGGVWVSPPDVPRPDDCPPRRLPFNTTSIFDRVELRLAKGRSFEELSAGPLEGDGADSALWARVPGHLEPSAATLAIFGDYVTGGVSQSIGRQVMTRSLDNTLRMVSLEPTEWVLCDIRIQALVGGYGQGIAYLWSESGSLLATASQSMSVRLWD